MNTSSILGIFRFYFVGTDNRLKLAVKYIDHSISNFRSTPAKKSRTNDSQLFNQNGRTKLWIRELSGTKRTDIHIRCFTDSAVLACPSFVAYGGPYRTIIAVRK